MSKCEFCQKKACKCEENGKKILKKLSDSNVLEASLRDRSLFLCLFSVKKGEYYVKFSPKATEIVKVLTKGEYDSTKGVSVPEMVGGEIDEGFYFLERCFFHLRFQKDSRCFQLADELLEITPEAYLSSWQKYKFDSAGI